MAETQSLEQLIKSYKNQGMSALTVQQKLREQGLNIPWLEVKMLYQKSK